MPTTSTLPGSVRSAAAVNQDIRALWQAAGTTLTGAQAAEYQRLLVEWAAAVRAEREHTQAA